METLQRAASISPGDCFGRLSVVRALPRNKHGQRVWLCRCACGEEAVVTQSNLRRGQVSCGCIKAEVARRRITHGHAQVGRVTREYSVWLMMKDRCLNPDSRGFYNYGARGIRVCCRWQDSFEAFLADLGPRPSSGHSLERLDVNGHYEPGNVVWATKHQQAANTRRNRFVTYQGQRVHVSEAARLSGISLRTILSRLCQGWPEDRLFLPADPRRRDTYTPKTGRPDRAFVTYRGERIALTRLAAQGGIGHGTLRTRIAAGWPEEDWLAPPGSLGHRSPHAKRT